MSADTLDRTVLPPDEDGRRVLEELAALLSGVGEPARLVGPDGSAHPIPDETYRVLQDVVRAMAGGRAITVAPHDLVMTTQEAAELLGISRPTLIKLLERGEIPFEKPSRHRRVRLTDVLDYQQRSRRHRKQALREMVAVSEELGLYDDEHQ